MGGKRLTYKETRDFVCELGYELVTEGDIKDKQKIVLKDSLGYFYVSILNNLKTGFKPRFALKSNPYTIQNIELWCKLNDKPFELIEGQRYDRCDINLKWKCLKETCGEIFDATWISISCDRGCPFCSGKQVGLSNCIATRNPELASEWHPTKNKGLTPYNITHGSMKRVWWKCKTCNHEWFVSPNARCRNNSGCPKCRESKGEKQIDAILTQYSIPHDYQYSFDDLVGIKGGILKFDVPVFADKDKKQLTMLIEYDGEQHFRWVKGMMSKKRYEILQINDKRKDEYCKNNNIKLIRIPYWDFDNIEEILIKEVTE